MRYFSFNEGMVQPFRIKEGDGTDKDLTGMTVIWRFTTRDGTITTIVGIVTNAVLGQCSFTIPAGFFTVAIKYTSQINLNDGVAFDEDTEPFTVDIDNPTQRTS